ncbi:TRAP transporter small permease [Arenibacter sp. ARW7G5Y1]|uniref:TRAP transporter small permease n=1 Tax=Arenibacter sp. ARW7G5Y1 TaxID=2135619 RepID=UPI0035C93AAD
MLLLIFGAVVSRYIFNTSFYWSDEIARYCFVWLIFLSAALAVKEKQHIRVTYFIDLLPDNVRKNIILLGQLLFLFFLIFLVISGFIWVLELKNSNSPALGLPLNIVLYSALPVGSLLSIPYVIKQIINTYNNRKTQDL